MLVVVLVLGESECFRIGLTEQNNCRINGGLCRQRTPMHRGRARRRGRERFPNFGIWIKLITFYRPESRRLILASIGPVPFPAHLSFPSLLDVRARIARERVPTVSNADHVPFARNAHARDALRASLTIQWFITRLRAVPPVLVYSFDRLLSFSEWVWRASTSGCGGAPRKPSQNHSTMLP